MGQRQSVTHGYFLTALQALLKEKGIKISQTTLRDFFDLVQQLCPWFPECGSVNTGDWQRVGQTLKNELKIRGDVLPSTTWSTWSCIKEVLDPTDSIEVISMDSKEPISEPSSPSNPEPPSLAPLKLKDSSDEDPFDGPYLEDQRHEAFLSSVGPPLLHVPKKDKGKTPPEALGLFHATRGEDISYPIRGVTPLQRTLFQAADRGEDVSDFLCFPVTVQNGQRAYAALSFKVLKDLKQACSQYGPIAPFTLSMLDNLTREALCPGDWRVIAQACLSPGDNLLWKTQFSENADRQAAQNRRTAIPVDYNMLTGSGPYYDVGLQLDFPEIAYTQINTCALSAWKKLPSNNARTQELSKIRQGPDESYSDFVARLLQAVGRIVSDHEAGTVIVKQLAFENANSACQAAIRPWRTQGTLEDYIRLCADIGTSYLQGVTLAAAFKGIPPAQMHSQLLKKGTFPKGNKTRACFSCGQLGHFKNQCPQNNNLVSSITPSSATPTPNNKPKPQSICPKCRRGYHWANECRSKTDCNGNPISGNGKRGPTPRAPQTIAALFPTQPTPVISQELTDYTAVPPPVQD